MILLLCAALLSLPAAACPGVQARDAWIREAPPGATVMAGYVTLVNGGTKARVVRKIGSADFGAIEIHRTVIEHGESHMEALDAVKIPAGGEARLAPGGMHLMLFRAARELKAGDTVTLLLYCGRKTPLKVDFTVRTAP